MQMTYCTVLIWKAAKIFTLVAVNERKLEPSLETKYIGVLAASKLSPFHISIDSLQYYLRMYN